MPQWHDASGKHRLKVYTHITELNETHVAFDKSAAINVDILQLLTTVKQPPQPATTTHQSQDSISRIIISFYHYHNYFIISWPIQLAAQTNATYI